MIIDSKYTKKFVSGSLTHTKYNELHEFAVCLRDFKNQLSKEISKNIFYYLDVKPLEFVTMMYSKNKGLINSSFSEQLYTQVLICYQNKFKAIQRNLSFEKITFLGFEFYKRETKKYKKGDFKKVVLKREKSKLSICLSYLARFGNEYIVEYIHSQIDNADENKKKFYNNILTCINKFGLNRLLNLALSKRNRAIKHYAKYPVEFKSLSFSGKSRKVDIISYNGNYNSVINSFISLSGLNRKSFDIPINSINIIMEI